MTTQDQHPRYITRAEALTSVFAADRDYCTLRLHHCGRMRGEGLFWPDAKDGCEGVPSLEAIGFIEVDCGRVRTYWHPISGQVWTCDADAWVVDVSRALARALDEGRVYVPAEFADLIGEPVGVDGAGSPATLANP